MIYTIEQYNSGIITTTTGEKIGIGDFARKEIEPFLLKETSFELVEKGKKQYMTIYTSEATLKFCLSDYEIAARKEAHRDNIFLLTLSFLFPPYGYYRLYKTTFSTKKKLIIGLSFAALLVSAQAIAGFPILDAMQEVFETVEVVK